MRAFALFIALMAAAVVGGALLAYPAYSPAHELGADWPFHRVANRLAMLALLVGLLWMLRRLKLANRAALGYAAPRRQFLSLAARALAIGAVLMAPVIAMLLMLELRDPNAGLTTAAIVTVALKGLVGGVVVAFIEETFFRGAMHSAIERESGAAPAVALTALVYACVHFLNRVRIPHESVDWGSGFDLMARTFSAFGDPLRIVDSFLALFAVGVLLGLVRLRYGHIAACVGLHAGWVWIITITRELTTRASDSPASFLVGSYDGVIGYLVLGWTLALIAVFEIVRRRRASG